MSKPLVHWPLDKVEFVPRSEFLQGLVREPEGEQQAPIEDTIIHMANTGVRMDGNTLYLAQSYKQFRDRDARLPNFSRWATGMFRDDKELAKTIAQAGQMGAVHGPLTVRTDPVSILKAGDSPHYHSCLKYVPGSTGRKEATGEWANILKWVCEETPGIAIVGIDGEDNRYIGRCWLHHARERGTGRDVVVPFTPKGQLSTARIVSYLKRLGATVALPINTGTGWTSTPGEGTEAVVDYVGCFERAIHWDLWTMYQDRGYTVKIK